MSIQIAIPEPTSDDLAYNERCLPSYLFALRSAGVDAVVIPLNESPERVAELLELVDGILLPGSGHDVDPRKYNEMPLPECGPADDARSAMDELLLRDAFARRKPVLAVCYGTQTLNVWLNGTLIQDLKLKLNTPIEHAPDRSVLDAHRIEVSSGSRLGALIENSAESNALVNSSHHQAVRVPGKGLRVTAVSPADGVAEAIELDSNEHFVLGVQWHPERTYAHSDLSRSIFSAFGQAAELWHRSRQCSPLGSTR